MVNGYATARRGMNRHEGMYYDDHTEEMFGQDGRQELYEDKKLKRRESDAKCRANISAGFDILKEQVHASGSQEKVSKETVLQESLVRVKYLEGVLVALHQTKELSKGGKEELEEISPLQHLRNVHHQFVAFQQRKWSQPRQRQAKDITHTLKDKQDGIRRMAKRRRPKHRSVKKSPLVIKQKKRSPIIHLPPALHTPSRPQKHIKLASTESSQDQVVPLSSILNPALQMPVQSGTKKGANCDIAGSQMVPEGPCSRKEDMQQENLYTNENVAPPSPMVDVCRTPCKAGLLRGSISTPMKTYQIVGTSITPVKMDYRTESVDDRGDRVPASRTVVNSPDLECDEEPTSWPEDDSSSSSGSMPELHINHPWFSTPVRPTSLLKGKQPLIPPTKQRRPPSEPPVLEPQIETGKGGNKLKVCREASGEKALQNKASRANLKSKCTTPRKKYQKRATAARVRAWDPAKGKVLSPVQLYSGVFKTHQHQKAEVSSKSHSPAIDPDSLTGYLEQKLPTSAVGEHFMEQLDSEIVYTRDFTEESDEEIIDVFGSDSAEAGSESSDPVPGIRVDQTQSEDSSPTCLRDVSLPPPAGTISPPSLVIPYGVEYDDSPELFKGYRSVWLKETRGDTCIAVDAGPEMDCYHQINNEEGFYDYHQQNRCHPDDAAMMDQEEDLFEADLGDMRHLDPALQPPSSSLNGEDYIVHFCGDRLEEPDSIDVMSDVHVKESRGSSLHDKQGNRASTMFTHDVLITPALASFATSALSVKHARRPNKKGQRRRRNIRLNLTKASPDSAEEEDDLNIWKFTQAALNEKDVLRFLPADSSYTFITNNF